MRAGWILHPAFRALIKAQQQEIDTLRGQLTSLANKLAVRPTKAKVEAILPATMPLLPTPLISRVSTVL